MRTLAPLLISITVQVQACFRTVNMQNPTTTTTTTAMTTTTKSCKTGYTLCAASGFCFKAVSNAAGITQPAAENACVADGGDLASIHSMSENACVDAVIAADPLMGTGSACAGAQPMCPGTVTCLAWFGIERNPTAPTGTGLTAPTTDFIYTDRTTVDYTDWLPVGNGLDEPNNFCPSTGSRENCGMIYLMSPYTDGWGDYPCEATNIGYVCKQAQM